MELIREYNRVYNKEHNINIYQRQYNLKFQRSPPKPSHWVNWRLEKNNEIRNEINKLNKLKHHKEFNLHTTLCIIKL